MSKAKTPKRSFAAGLNPNALSAALLATAALAQGAAAQQLTGFPQAELPRYAVELIVFTYAEGSATGNEIFVPESPPFEDLVEGAGRHPDAALPVFGDPGGTDDLTEAGDPVELGARPAEPGEEQLAQ
ncbi:MAG TPA: hypothetical protein VHG33_06795, partial [Woeseiaceae bacterium]|nr:hypothetical protein [Woeseiaceae bacterium]